MNRLVHASLGEVAKLNPTFKARTVSPDEIVDFLPMSAVSAELTTVRATEQRQLCEVQKGYTNFADGDVLLAKITPCFENGKIAFAQLNTAYGFGSTEFHVIRANSERLDGRYLVHFLRRDEVRVDGARNMTGSAGQRRVPKHYLESLSIPLPILSEQRRIAAILDQADTLRAKRREALAQLDSLTQSIFIEIFGDPLTNSKGWPTKSLGEVTTLFGGNSLPEGEPFLKQKGGLFLMKVSDMNLPGNEKTIERCQSWSSVTGARSATCPAGSIVIPKRGGAIGTNKKRVTKRETILDPNLMAISPNSTFIEREYLFQWFQRFDLSTIASGSSVPQLNKQDLMPLKIQIPPRSIQQIFSARIEAIEVIKVSSAAALVKLDTLFASLQHRAFQGEL